MIKLLKISIFLCFVFCCNCLFLYAQSISPYYNLLNSLDISDTNSYTIIDKINEYQIQYYVIDEMKRVEEHFNDRIYFEMHLGGGFFHPIGKPGFCSSPLRDRFIGYLSIKVNLFNPKIPQPHKILSRINKIDYLLTMKKVKIDEKIKKNADHIKNEVDKYNSQTWFKRISLGLTIPLYGQSDRLKFKDFYVFSGYDIKDLLTLQFGCSIDTYPNILCGISMDISTPVLAAAQSFISSLASLFGLRSSYYSPYGYDY